MISRENIGLDIVVLGTIISVIGVVYNNLMLDHVTAMEWWVFSNTAFTVYFYGRWKCWWDGGLADEVMCGLYAFMLASGIWGLWK